MSKNKSKKSDRFTEHFTEIASIDETGGGDETIDVAVRRYVMVECPRTEIPIELNAWEARKLGRALLKAANRLDGSR